MSYEAPGFMRYCQQAYHAKVRLGEPPIAKVTTDILSGYEDFTAAREDIIKSVAPTPMVP